MQNSIFWYDYETTGINPRADRPLQMAGIRTDEDLNIIADPVNFYCRLSEDILPHPKACVVTGITPQILAEKGLNEADFIARVHHELSLPGTCGAGYNTLRFDDEVTRYSFYRNFYDPYAREWQGGNSRWDLIDVVRTAYALRPEGIEWPQEEGVTSLKLELLSQANGLAHTQAHDALSDVYATIALAKLIKTKQPKLFRYLYAHRSKQAVAGRIKLLEPMVHISGQFGSSRRYLAPVLPLAWHPTNRNALIVADLGKDLSPLLNESVEVLRARLYTRHDALDGKLPIALKLVHLNKCPVLLPLAIVRPEDRERLAWHLNDIEKSAELFKAQQQMWLPKVTAIYQEEFAQGSADPEQQLYEGFISKEDRLLCNQIRLAEPAHLPSFAERFKDKRLPKLLFRHLARNYPHVLDDEQKAHWHAFCRKRLRDEHQGAPMTLEAFNHALKVEWQVSTEQGQEILKKWQAYVSDLEQRYQ